MTDLTVDKDGNPLFSKEKQQDLERSFFHFACLMERLRQECPWDVKQTPDSMKRYILEEAYEVLETIEDRDWNALRDELGDYMLQALFLAKMNAEEARFDIADVLRDVVTKMVRRHPHVYGETQVSGSEEVLANWDQIKKQEKGEQTSVYDNFPRGLPALLESYKIGKKAGKVGFDWPEPNQVLDKLEEEIREIREALEEGNRDHVREELGDLLFAVSNLTRKLECEPEETLRAANRKFIKRFRAMEDLAREDGVDFYSLDLDSQEAYWGRAKEREGES